MLSKITFFQSLLILSAFILLSLFQHIPHIHKDIQGIHCWRQSQTMWNVRNFVRHDYNILNPRINSFNGGKENILRYEFPIMQWAIASAQKVFGEKIEVVRLFVFIIGIFSTLGIFLTLVQIFSNKATALLTTVLFQYSPVFFYYTINPIPDNLALCCSIWYLYFILTFFKTKNNARLLLASLFLLLATLSKLPFLMFSIISIQHFIKSIFRKQRLTSQNLKFALTQLVILTPALIWYIWVMPTWHGNPILQGVVAEEFHYKRYLGILWYHATYMFPIILLSIPALPLFIIGIYSWVKSKNHNTIWLVSLVGITFLYFFLQLNTIDKIHDYYMLPFLPWLFIIVGMGIRQLIKYSQKSVYLLGLICFTSVIYTYFFTIPMWSIKKSYFNPDVFIYTEELKSAVPDGEHCIILNDLSSYIFSYRIDKMGYVFNDDNLKTEWINEMVKSHNIKYMYSDSEKINSSEELAPYIDDIIMTRGSIKVFKLKVYNDN